MERYPEKGELVITTVDKVLGYGAFVHLDEYDNKQGIVSISEFSPKWVKNPRDYFKEGQKIVLRVLRINSERGHIDLSLKRVNENESRNRIKAYQFENRARRLLDYFAKHMDKKPEEMRALFGDRLTEDYGSLYEGLSNVANDKEDLKDYIKNEEMRLKVVKAIKDNIKPTLVSVRGFVTMHSEAGNAIDAIKAALLAGEKSLPKGVDGSISYVSPPNYRIDVTAADYKIAEKIMRDCADVITNYASSHDIEAEFNRELKKAA